MLRAPGCRPALRVNGAIRAADPRGGWRRVRELTRYPWWLGARAGVAHSLPGQVEQQGGISRQVIPLAGLRVLDLLPDGSSLGGGVHYSAPPSMMRSRTSR